MKISKNWTLTFFLSILSMTNCQYLCATYSRVEQDLSSNSNTRPLSNHTSHDLLDKQPLEDVVFHKLNVNSAHQDDTEVEDYLAKRFEENERLFRKDFFSKLHLAAQGDADAQYRLALIYLSRAYGRHVENKRINPHIEARKWLEAAANQGHVAAQHTLSCLIRFESEKKTPQTNKVQPFYPALGQNHEIRKGYFDNNEEGVPQKNNKIANQGKQLNPVQVQDDSSNFNNPNEMWAIKVEKRPNLFHSNRGKKLNSIQQMPITVGFNPEAVRYDTFNDRNQEAVWATKVRNVSLPAPAHAKKSQADRIKANFKNLGKIIRDKFKKITFSDQVRVIHVKPRS